MGMLFFLYLKTIFIGFSAICQNREAEETGRNRKKLFPCNETTAQPEKPASALPPELGIPSQLLPILERGQKAGFLDDEYKPIPKSMTRPQQKRFALLACIEAGLDNYCNRFGRMWGCDYNGVDESRGAAQRRKAIDSLFAQDIINKAKLK